MPGCFSTARTACREGLLPDFAGSDDNAGQVAPVRTHESHRMLALIQRVTHARVEVDGETIGAIGPGLLALVGIEPADGEAQVLRMSERLLGYRIFGDDAGRMNRSLSDCGGGLLLVSQFTLAADTASGLRPGFSTAATPAEAEPLFARLVELCRQKHPAGVETGQFGAHMLVSLVNDGPVTFMLRA
jgi:D-aminoacyl-tRNA deacylase